MPRPKQPKKQCTGPECTNDARARGWCWAHYVAHHIRGNPLKPLRPKMKAPVSVRLTLEKADLKALRKLTGEKRTKDAVRAAVKAMLSGRVIMTPEPFRVARETHALWKSNAVEAVP